MNLDAILEKTTKNNLYLFFRLSLYVILTLFSLQGLYNIKNINAHTYFNNLLLYSSPLVIEYIFGLKCYSNILKWCKTFGFLIAASLCIISIFGIFELSTIVIDEHNLLIKELYLYKTYFNILGYVKISPMFLCLCILGDWMFSYNPEELRFYNIISDIENDINKRMEEAKKQDMFEQEKNGNKDKYRNKVGKSIKGNP